MYYNLSFIVPENDLTKAFNINGCKLIGFKTTGSFVDIWVDKQTPNKDFSFYGDKRLLLPEILQQIETNKLTVYTYKIKLEILDL